MYNDLFKIYNPAIIHKKTGLKMIISLFALTVLFSMHTLASKPDFDTRIPEETAQCRQSVSGKSIHKNIGHFIRYGCYSALRELLKNYKKEEETEDANSSPVKSEIYTYLKSALEKLESTRANRAAHWDIVDLLLSHANKTDKDYMYSLFQERRKIMAKLSIHERLYMAARFLSRHNTAKALMTEAELFEVHDSMMLDFSREGKRIDTLIPFGWPLLYGDQLHAFISTYNGLSKAEQKQLDKVEFMQQTQLSFHLDSLKLAYKGIQPALSERSFIVAHQKAYRDLLNALMEKPQSESANNTVKLFQPASTVNKLKCRGKRARGFPGPSIVHGVITMKILRDALHQGLNPNTFMPGIDFDFETMRSMTFKEIYQIRKPKKNHTLLHWAAMGNITDATADEAVNILLSAGANPHNLPDNWSSTKNKWLKKWQEKIDTLDLPYSRKEYELHELIPFDPNAREAEFMRRYQEYLRWQTTEYFENI